MRYLLIVSVLITGLLAVGQGFNMPSFSFFDTNGDGKITQAELDDGRTKRRNKNVSEGKRLRNVANAESFSQIDKNADGFISKEEFAAYQNRKK